MTGALARALGPWAAPPDAASRGALAIALVLVATALVPRGAAAFGLFAPSALTPSSRRRFLTVTGFAAAFLSLGYIAVYLRGGPRIIDATSYFMQGRALSHGALAWPIPEGAPSASFRGRFLLSHDGHLAGIFPPGYPALLALGFLLGAPMVIGPVLAAALVVATYALAREIAANALDVDPHGNADVEGVARLAALLSVACAALRYHTADTMSHGAAATFVTCAFALALHARRTTRAPLRAWLGAGLAVGALVSTRLASAVPVALVAAALATRTRQPRAALGILALGLAPGVALLFAAQHAATGALFASTQRAYYAQADGPEGCFRYGFGAGIGCVYEHAEYVKNGLTGGYGVGAAILTSLRRLHMHLGDVLNAGPLALLALVPVRDAARGRSAVAASYALIAGFVVVYAPFYFDGSYPGGGARFFADVLPVEHALVALAAFRLAPTIAFARKAAGLLALALGAFALHAVAWHVQLADRDGGRPMYEPDVARRAHVEKALVLFETDHGMNLASDPSMTTSRGIVAAHAHGDDHDRVLFDSLGRPPAYLYKLGETGPTLVPWTPPMTVSTLTGYAFEAEAEWPPLAQSGGWVTPRWASGTCASGSRTLGLFALPTGAPASTHAEAWLELPVPETASYNVTPYAMALGGQGRGVLELTASRGDTSPTVLARWEWHDDGIRPCLPLEAAHVALTAPRAYLRFAGEQAGASPEISVPAVDLPPVVSLDRIELTKAPR